MSSLIPSKKLGVLGGMGPLATASFFSRLVSRTPAHRDQDHLDTLVVCHATLPDRTETILSGDPEPFFAAIRPDFAVLETYGVSNIAIPCNTSHYYYDELSAMTAIPVINMVEETLRTISVRFAEARRVAVLCTNGTRAAGVYDRYAKAFNQTIVYPEGEDQRAVMQAIYDLKQTGRLEHLQLIGVINRLLRFDADVVVLACTELSLMSLEVDERVLDAMDVLVNEAIRRSREVEPCDS